MPNPVHPPRIVIIVQARMSSSRLPGKVLKPVLGEPLLFRMIERLQQIRHEAALVVATSIDASDDVIAEACQANNVLCFRGSLSDCLDRHYQLAKAYEADVAIKIPSDCPLIDPAVVDEVIDFYLHHSDEYDFVSNLHPATFPDGNDVEIMPIAMLEKAWQEASRPLEREHTTPYFWENPQQFRLGNVLWSSGLDYSMSHRFTIDYQEDYEFICRVFEELYPNNPRFGLLDILNLLEANPAIYEINSKFAGVNWYRNHLAELKTVSAEHTKQVL
ncbi:MAG: glycosyltransferase family protein [Spirosomataceae bacterium]